MVRDIGADRTIVMGDSILVMMECKSQYRERKANEQETNKFSVHQSMKNKRILPSATRPQSLLMSFNAVSLPSEVLISFFLNLG
jgi:hypothetical protein